MARETWAPVESFSVGDVGRFTRHIGDSVVSVTGIVGEVRYLGKERELYTPEGHLLTRYNVGTPRKVHAAVISRYTPRQEQLL